jgi:hypothetical protein
MIEKSRRGFLRMLPALPIGARVAAKEAATAMGLSSITSAAAGFGAPGIPITESAYYHGAPNGPDEPWFMRELREFAAPHRVAQRMEQARYQGRMLDADLASCRSLSPSAAYQIQVQRCFQRSEQTFLERLNRQKEEWLAQQPLIAAAKAGDWPIKQRQ